MSNPGYIYALINPALEGLVKIGKTTTNPVSRANQLSSATGVPMQFMVAHSVLVSDCDLAEKYAHGLLEKKGFRVSSNREFFQAPLPVAIDAIKSTASFIGIITDAEFNSPACEEFGNDKFFDNSAWVELEHEADRNHNLNMWLQHEFTQETLDLWHKAAEAGCIRAYFKKGCIHLIQATSLLREINNNRTFLEKLLGDDRESRRNNHITKGLECHRVAIKSGYDLSYAALGHYFCNAENTTEAKKHWDLFFQSNTFRKRIDPHNDFSFYCSCYESFLHFCLKIDAYEANYHAKQKFDA